MNGDSYPDIIAADGSISVLLRVPGGAFQTPVNYTLQSGSSAVSVATGDLSGDGHTDVVAASAYTDQSGNLNGTIDVALGSASGTLGTQASYPLGGNPGGLLGVGSAGVVVADFNGDNSPDVAAGFQGVNSGVGGVSVSINNGKGALQPAVPCGIGNFSAYCTIAGDFNGDTKSDLAVCAGAPSGSAGAMAILLNNGNGTFQNAVSTQLSGKPLAAAVADVNGDGIPDLVVGDCCGQTESVYLLGKGDGTFQSPIYFSSGTSVAAFAVTSWNNDGIAGLAIAQQGSPQGSAEAAVSALNLKLYSSPPTLSITKSHTGNFTAGQQGAAYTVMVSNAANAAPVAGTVTVTDSLPSGLSLVSMTGNNWTCSANTCTRNDALAGGSSYDAITVTVNVAPAAPSPQVNQVSVSGGGSASANATDSTIIAPGSPPPGGVLRRPNLAGQRRGVPAIPGHHSVRLLRVRGEHHFLSLRHGVRGLCPRFRL